MAKKILIVDDEPDVITYFSTVLQDEGYQTIDASNGEIALQKIREEKPDLVTLDITMPERSGVGTYRELKESEELKGIPILIVTGVSPDFKQFISSRRQVPAPDGFLEKPVRHEQLLAEVKRLIG